MKQQALFDDTPPARKDKRARFQFRFWIDASKDDELLLGEELDDLKGRRQFQPTIRDALRLILSLRRGDVSVLLALFPRIRDMLKVEESTANAEFKALLERQAVLLERLADGEIVTTKAPPSSFELVRFDDDDDGMGNLIEVKKDTSTDAAQNFLSSFGF